MKLLESLPQEKLTRPEEDKLSNRIQASKGSDEKSVNVLVLHSMQEAFFYAKKICDGKLQDDELFSLCYKELVRSAKRFRTGYCRFFAFCKPGIRGAIARFWGTKDVVKNVSSTNMLSLDIILDAPQRRDHDAKATKPLIGAEDDYDASHPDEPKENAAFDAIDAREKLAIVMPIMQAKLTAQEFMVLDLLYIGGFNFQEVADLLDVCRSAIQSAHNKGMRKIRAELARRKQLLNSDAI